MIPWGDEGEQPEPEPEAGSVLWVAVVLWLGLLLFTPIALDREATMHPVHAGQIGGQR